MATASSAQASTIGCMIRQACSASSSRTASVASPRRMSRMRLAYAGRGWPWRGRVEGHGFEADQVALVVDVQVGLERRRFQDDPQHVGGAVLDAANAACGTWRRWMTTSARWAPSALPDRSVNGTPAHRQLRTGSVTCASVSVLRPCDEAVVQRLLGRLLDRGAPGPGPPGGAGRGHLARCRERARPASRPPLAAQLDGTCAADPQGVA